MLRRSNKVRDERAMPMKHGAFHDLFTDARVYSIFTPASLTTLRQRFTSAAT